MQSAAICSRTVEYMVAGRMRHCGHAGREGLLECCDVQWMTAGRGRRLLRSAGEPARLLLLAGMPLNEPIVEYGPLVIKTQREIFHAVADFRGGKF